MNQLKKTTFARTLFAVLGIGAAVGLGSLIISPWGFWEKTSVGWKRVPEPTKITDWTMDVYFYRVHGELPCFPTFCGMEPEENVRIAVRKHKVYRARIIAEAKRQDAQQEAQEATCPRLP